MRVWLLTTSLLSGCSSSGDAERKPDYSKTGGIEVVLTFGGDEVDSAKVRRAVEGSDTFTLTWKGSPAVGVRAELRPADPARQEIALEAVRSRVGPALVRARWSGDRLHLRSTAAVVDAHVHDALASSGFEVVDVRRWHDEATGEHDVTITTAGQEVRIERAVEAALGVEASIEQVQVVGPQRKRR